MATDRRRMVKVAEVANSAYGPFSNARLENNAPYSAPSYSIGPLSNGIIAPAAGTGGSRQKEPDDRLFGEVYERPVPWDQMLLRDLKEVLNKYIDPNNK